MSDEEYNLKKSKDGIGPLVPILKDKQGNIIDGFHRQEIDSNWPSVVCELVDNPTKLVKARLASNFCRRRVPHEEIHDAIVYLVGKAGLKPDQIAEELGISRATIYRHLPQTMKQPKAAVISKALKEKSEISRHDVSRDTSHIKIQDTTTPETGYATQVQCDCCGMGTNNPRPFGRYKQLCESCWVKAIKNPRAYAREHKPKPQVKPFKPKETWAQRQAVMHPQHSKMEEAISRKLETAGVRPIITDRKFCLQSTTPDYYFPNKNLAVYVDGPVHQKREDRDNRLRSLLTKRTGIQVLAIPYKSNSQKETERVFNVIKEALE